MTRSRASITSNESVSVKQLELEVAETFWEYMKENKPMPESKTKLRQLYLNVYRPLLDFPLRQRVKFSSVLSCMETSGFLKTAGEILYYQVEQNPRVKVKEGKENTNTQLSAACNNQELRPHNGQKRGLNGKEGKNLDTERYSALLIVLEKMNMKIENKPVANFN